MMKILITLFAFFLVIGFVPDLAAEIQFELSPEIVNPIRNTGSYGSSWV